MTSRRVLVVEDLAEVRAAVVALLGAPGSGFSVVGEVSTLAHAREVLRSGVAFDVALVDVGLPDGRGTSFVSEVRQARPAAACVVFSVYDDPETVLTAVRAGARGYLLKSTPPEQLAAKLGEAADGGSPLSPAIARHVLEALTPNASETAKVTSLTPREREVLALLAKGCSYSEVAQLLGIGLGTVQGYVKVVYEKLDVSSKAEATALAVRAGVA